MPVPTANATPVPMRFVRHLVLCTPFLIGLAFAFASRPATVHAQAPGSPSATTATAPKPASMSKTVTITDGKGTQAKIEVKRDSDGTDKDSATPGDAGDGQDAATAADGKSASGLHGVIIGKHGRIQIDGRGTDGELDSVGDFVNDSPAIAAMVVAIVAVVFLAPVLLIGLVLWYRMRKARMLNETMLKLAERGIVTSADALEALAGGKQAALLATAAAAAPLYQQAQQTRRRAAWSDLRKGVLTGGAGIALTLYSWLERRGPNGLGLVLLFVGIGFIVMWWLEERQIAPAAGVAASPGPSTGASGTASGGPPPAA